MDAAKRTVAVLGASAKRERHSNKAVRLLKSEGFRVVPVHPALQTVEGIPVVSTLEGIRDPVDTLTLYVGPDHSLEMADAILALRPGRVIFNPGTETPELQARLTAAGIPFLEACTLVMLSTGQF
jgi:predicted CoA-binding protein